MSPNPFPTRPARALYQAHTQLAPPNYVIIVTHNQARYRQHQSIFSHMYLAARQNTTITHQSSPLHSHQHAHSPAYTHMHPHIHSHYVLINIVTSCACVLSAVFVRVRVRAAHACALISMFCLGLNTQLKLLAAKHAGTSPKPIRGRARAKSGWVFSPVHRVSMLRCKRVRNGKRTIAVGSPTTRGGFCGGSHITHAHWAHRCARQKYTIIN